MFFNVLLIIILVILAGTFAGLTLALFSLKLTMLETKMRAGDQRAAKVYKIRKKGNLLLCTLLLGNVASYTIMAIFLGSITTGVIAGFVATTLIFIFGEILPQAVFPRHALVIGAKLYWAVRVLLVLFYPISAPMAWLLDKILGKEAPMLWSKEELGELVRYHEDMGDGIIDKDEERIILGALSFSDIKTGDIMIHKTRVFFLEPDTKINHAIINKIKKKGYSRMPVYNSSEKKIIGILYAKDLLDMPIGTKAGVICDTSNIIVVDENMKLDTLLNMLIKRKMHMALVTNETGDFSGIATLEDIVEEILKTELEDHKNVTNTTLNIQ